MRIVAIIEKGKDGLFSAYSENEVHNHCFGGYGNSVEAAKEDFLLSVEEAKKDIESKLGVICNIEVKYKFDLASFFDYFDCINISKFAKLAGINESKMRQYKIGAAFAGEKTTKKILFAIKKLGAELSTVSI